MSDKEWYEGLTGKDLAGKHVHAVFKTGTVVDGRLEWDGLMYVSSTRQVAVLGPGNGGSWELSPGVESVPLVWDERDWEQIDVKDLAAGDAAAVGGRLFIVRYLALGAFVVDGDVGVPFRAVSCALRRRSKLPTEQGFYRGADGTLLILFHSARADDRWMYASRDFLESGAYVGDEVARKYLPLTPVHFVDGRAE